SVTHDFCATATPSSISPTIAAASAAGGPSEPLALMREPVRALVSLRMRTRKPKLTQEERHEEILALLRHEGTVRIATLARTFAVTTETARRDLDELAVRGAIMRTYG